MRERLPMPEWQRLTNARHGVARVLRAFAAEIETTPHGLHHTESIVSAYTTELDGALAELRESESVLPPKPNVSANPSFVFDYETKA